MMGWDLGLSGLHVLPVRWVGAVGSRTQFEWGWGWSWGVEIREKAVIPVVGSTNHSHVPVTLHHTPPPLPGLFFSGERRGCGVVGPARSMVANEPQLIPGSALRDIFECLSLLLLLLLLLLYYITVLSLVI